MHLGCATLVLFLALTCLGPQRHLTGARIDARFLLDPSGDDDRLLNLEFNAEARTIMKHWRDVQVSQRGGLAEFYHET